MNRSRLVSRLLPDNWMPSYHYESLNRLRLSRYNRKHLCPTSHLNVVTGGIHQQSVLDEASARKAASCLRQSGIRTVIITLGERGAYLSTGNQEALIPAFQVTPVVTTAAGDAFVGGLAVALAEGKQLLDAVRWGNACGGLATTKLGAMPSLPARQFVEALLARNA